jgi:hypothetical protein
MRHDPVNLVRRCSVASRETVVAYQPTLQSHFKLERSLEEELQEAVKQYQV